MSFHSNTSSTSRDALILPPSVRTLLTIHIRGADFMIPVKIRTASSAFAHCPLPAPLASQRPTWTPRPGPSSSRRRTCSSSARSQAPPSPPSCSMLSSCARTRCARRSSACPLSRRTPPTLTHPAPFMSSYAGTPTSRATARSSALSTISVLKRREPHGRSHTSD